MQVSTKFTIAIHLLVATRYFGDSRKVTSRFLAGSIGCNPVVVRNIMSQLERAGIISARRGSGGISLERPLSEVTFLDVYRAVETNGDGDLFRFHENPNPDCPVGGKIHLALDGELRGVQESFEEDLRGRTLQDVYDVIARQKTEA